MSTLERKDPTKRKKMFRVKERAKIIDGMSFRKRSENIDSNVKMEDELWTEVEVPLSSG